jgi:pyruvate ferredoxin oxidoreductase alpha subunit
MREQIEGSQAVARAVAHSRPEVVCAYPITPQTHIVEALSRMVHTGALSPCEFVNVESEFAAMSVAIGASAVGARAYTATASQGLLYMAEALFNASGLGLPIVMTVGNRAIGAPINIWNDQSDSMALRDSGWIQLYAPDNQEAVDVHVQAFRIAEELSLPVMVCMDGFVLTHALEPLEVPGQEAVDTFLPAFVPRQVLDPDEPMTIGAMVGPEAFTEVRYLAHAKQMHALDLIPEVAADFRARFGRASGGLLERYRADDATTVVVALGSVLGTLEEVIDELRDQGSPVGAVRLKCFRPLPRQELRAALAGAERVIVLERALAAGVGGILSADVHAALGEQDRVEGPASDGGCAGAARRAPTRVHTVIAGLGGRAITRRSLRRVLERALAGELEELCFLDLNMELVARELARSRAGGRPGPHAESILRDLGIVAAGPV